MLALSRASALLMSRAPRFERRSMARLPDLAEIARKLRSRSSKDRLGSTSEPTIQKTTYHCFPFLSKKTSDSVFEAIERRARHVLQGRFAVDSDELDAVEDKDDARYAACRIWLGLCDGPRIHPSGRWAASIEPAEGRIRGPTALPNSKP